ncbi:MAG: S41 family peptidase [Phycisphaerales bacterium]|nr:S41 family peptidase [Phycisphaerales bacterium]
MSHLTFISISRQVVRLLMVTMGIGFPAILTQSTLMLEPPKVVELFPRNGATDVEPGVKELRITFDRDMSTGGYSLCGGGPTFPELIGQPKWSDKRTLVAVARLKADHDYRMSLNCQAGQYFRSVDGAPLTPVPWEFSTATAVPKRSKAKQKKLNKRCLKQLMKLLESQYSYHELRGIDWKALNKKHRKKIIASSNERTWVKRTAKMLSALKDMHLWLEHEGKIIPTYRRNLKPNFDLEGIRTILPELAQRNRCVFTARTDENIGYILIGTLDNGKADDLAQIQDFLREYKDCSGLILDLRPNSGGDESLAKPIAGWFVEGEKVYAKNAYRDASAETGFGRVLSRTIRGHTPPRRFDKPVAVLMGPANMSSCEAFLLMLKQGKHVTMIGERSYGSSGNPKPHAMKNGVAVYIPSWKAMRPDGSCFEGEGIAPDIEVEAKPGKFKNGDPVLRRALKLLRKRDQ